MNKLLEAAAIFSRASQLRNDRIDEERSGSIGRLQARKLRDLVDDAASNVPYYRDAFARAGFRPGDADETHLLSGLPVSTKHDLASVPVEARLNKRFVSQALISERSGGSTGEPLEVRMETDYVARKNMRFLRALAGAGYRPGQKIMLINDRVAGAGRARLGWHYCSVNQRTAPIADAFRRIRPMILYGCNAALQLLAERVAGEHRPARVITTADVLTAAMRKSLAEAFGAPVLDFYGLTEMGLVAWQQPGRAGYLLASDSILIELLPQAHDPSRCHMLLTNLDLHAMPIIRFDCGDVAIVDDTPDGRQIVAFEGRTADILVSPNGNRISPYPVMEAMEDICELRRYKVTQIAADRLNIRIEADQRDHASISTRVSAIIAKLFGEPMQIDLEFPEQLIAEGTRKFRIVESKIVKHA